MKNIFILIMLFVISCVKAQETQPLFNNPNYGYEGNIYFKDLDNDLLKYVGLWRVDINASSYLEILFSKTIEEEPAINVLCDIIVGKCKYVVNNQVIVNTIDANTNSDFLIEGGLISENPFGLFKFECSLCSPSERYVIVGCSDNERPEMISFISMKTFNENNQIKLKMKIRKDGTSTFDVNSPDIYDDIRVPAGDYTLIKQ